MRSDESPGDAGGSREVLAALTISQLREEFFDCPDWSQGAAYLIEVARYMGGEKLRKNCVSKK